MRLRPILHESQEFLHKHEHQALTISRCIIAALALTLIGILASTLILFFN